MYYSKLYNVQNNPHMAVSLSTNSNKQIDFYNLGARKTTHSTTNHDSQKPRRVASNHGGRNLQDCDKSLPQSFLGQLQARSSDSKVLTVQSGRGTCPSKRSLWGQGKNRGESDDSKRTMRVNEGMRSIERDCQFNQRLM